MTGKLKCAESVVSEILHNQHSLPKNEDRLVKELSHVASSVKALVAKLPASTDAQWLNEASQYAFQAASKHLGCAKVKPDARQWSSVLKEFVDVFKRRAGASQHTVCSVMCHLIGAPELQFIPHLLPPADDSMESTLVLLTQARIMHLEELNHAFLKEAYCEFLAQQARLCVFGFLLSLTPSHNCPALQSWIDEEIAFLEGLRQIDSASGQENSSSQSRQGICYRAKEVFRTSCVVSRLFGHGRDNFWLSLMEEHLTCSVQRAAGFKELGLLPEGVAVTYVAPFETCEARVAFFSKIVSLFFSFRDALQREPLERMSSTRQLKSRINSAIISLDAQVHIHEARRFARDRIARATGDALSVVLPCVLTDFVASKETDCLNSMCRLVDETVLCVDVHGEKFLQTVCRQVLDEALDGAPQLTRLHLNATYLTTVLPRGKTESLYKLKADVQALLKKQPGQTLLYLLEKSTELQANISVWHGVASRDSPPMGIQTPFEESAEKLSRQLLASLGSLLNKERLSLDDAVLLDDVETWDAGEDIQRAYDRARKTFLKTRRPQLPRRRSMEPSTLWHAEQTANVSLSAFFDWFCDVFGGTDELLHVMWFHLTSESIKLFLGQGLQAVVPKAKELAKILRHLDECVGSFMQLDSMEPYVATMNVLNDVAMSRKLHRKRQRLRRASNSEGSGSLLMITDYFWPEARWDSAPIAFTKSRDLRDSPHLLFKSMRMRPHDQNPAFIRNMTSLMKEHDPHRASLMEAARASLTDKDLGFSSLPPISAGDWVPPLPEFAAALQALARSFSTLLPDKRAVMFPALATVEVSFSRGKSRGAEAQLRLPIIQAVILAILMKRGGMDVMETAQAVGLAEERCRHEVAALVRLKLIKVVREGGKTALCVAFGNVFPPRESILTLSSNDPFPSNRTSVDVLQILQMETASSNSLDEGCESLIRRLVLDNLRASLHDTHSAHVGFQPFKFWKAIQGQLGVAGDSATYADFGKVLSSMMDDGVVENRGGLYTLTEDQL